MRKVVSVAVIRDKKILLVKKKETWILPGGKPEEGERDIDCLFREIKEELPGITLLNLSYYGSFSGKSPNKRIPIFSEVYLSKKIKGIVFPSAEITKAEWTNFPEKYNLSDIAHKVVFSLYLKGHL